MQSISNKLSGDNDMGSSGKDGKGGDDGEGGEGDASEAQQVSLLWAPGLRRPTLRV